MEKETSPVGVRVATLNLWDRRGAWAERRSILADRFRELRQTPRPHAGFPGSLLAGRARWIFYHPPNR